MLERVNITQPLLFTQRYLRTGGTGWPSEVFGAERSLLNASFIRLWDRGNTEDFVKHLRRTTLKYQTRTLPPMNLTFGVRRSSDGALMTSL